MKRYTGNEDIEDENIMLIFTFLFLLEISIGGVSATTSGETYTHDFSSPIINCSITGNSSNLEGLELNWINSTATIITLVNYYPDNFTLSCWINSTIITQEKHHHSSSKKNVVNKSDTQKINNTIQETFNDTSFDNPQENKPVEIKPIEIKPVEPKEKNYFWWIFGSIVVLFVGVIIFLRGYDFDVKETKQIEFPKDENQTTN